jgi:hypothetical protein
MRNANIVDKIIEICNYIAWRKIMANKEELLKKLKKLNEIDDEFKVSMEEEDAFDFDTFSSENITQEKKAILGIDIYRYSRYEENKQKLIPFIFDLLIDETLSNLNIFEPSLFEHFNFDKNFIATGDGGFIILPTPFHAFIFNIQFYSILHLFNTGHFYPKLSKYISGIIIRSAISYGNIYQYGKNFYGKAIITNSRILTKDRLNRFLIDKESHDFFISKFNGIESLLITKRKNIERFLNIQDKLESNIFSEKSDKNIFNWCLKNIHVQKINDLSSKNTILEVYNVEVQFLSGYTNNDEDTNEHTLFILTIGNSNLAGLNDD